MRTLRNQISTVLIEGEVNGYFGNPAHFSPASLFHFFFYPLVQSFVVARYPQASRWRGGVALTLVQHLKTIVAGLMCKVTRAQRVSYSILYGWYRRDTFVCIRENVVGNVKVD